MINEKIRDAAVVYVNGLYEYQLDYSINTVKDMQKFTADILGLVIHDNFIANGYWEFNHDRMTAQELIDYLIANKTDYK